MLIFFCMLLYDINKNYSNLLLEKKSLGKKLFGQKFLY